MSLRARIINSFDCSYRVLHYYRGHCCMELAMWKIFPLLWWIPSRNWCRAMSPAWRPPTMLAFALTMQTALVSLLTFRRKFRRNHFKFKCQPEFVSNPWHVFGQFFFVSLSHCTDSAYSIHRTTLRFTLWVTSKHHVTLSLFFSFC